MTWKDEGEAVRLASDATATVTTPLFATATSTVIVLSAPSWMGLFALRMFGVQGTAIGDSVKPVTGSSDPDRPEYNLAFDSSMWPASALLEASPAPPLPLSKSYQLALPNAAYFGFIDSELGRLTHPATTVPEFTLLPAVNASTATAIYTKWEVVESTHAVWRYVATSGGWHGSYYLSASERMTVQYADHSVLQLPDGSWLMLVARVRMKAGDPPSGKASGKNSLGDIVAYWSASADFSAVVGPLWLISGVQAFPAVGPDSGWDGPNLWRCWLSTPAGVVVPGTDSKWLYVYFTSEAEGYDVVGAIAAEPDIVKTLTDAGFPSGTHAWHISVDDLNAFVIAAKADPAYYTDMSAWNDAKPADYLAPGEVLGPIQVEVDGVTDFKSMYSGFNPEFVDAMPVMCGPLRKDLRLFVRVWVRASMPPTSAEVEGVWRFDVKFGTLGIFGTRFKCSSDGNITHLMAPSGSPRAAYFDPDVVQVGSSWLMHVGRTRDLLLTDEKDYLNRIIGTDADVEG